MGIFRWDIAEIVRDLSSDYVVRQSGGVYSFERVGDRGHVSLTYDATAKTVHWTFRDGQNHIEGERTTWTNVGEDIRCVERLLFGHLMSMAGKKKSTYQNDQKAA